MCRRLAVSPSGDYGWRCRPESARAAANRQLLADVRRIHGDYHGRYGSPRVHAILRAEGRSASRGRVERLMHRHGIRALAGRRFRPCTPHSRHDLPIAPNLLKQEFCCYDNAPVEGFFHTCKVELVHQRRWSTKDEARRDLFAYIESFYNRQRIHSALGYITLEHAERKAS